MKTPVVPEESERCATAIGSFGRLTPGLSALIAGSFQLLISPDEDAADRLAVELQAGRCAVHVVGDHHGAERHRDVQDRALRCCCSVGVIGTSRGAEVDRLRLDLRDAAAGADPLVDDLDARLAGVGRRPERDVRRRERRACAAERGGPARQRLDRIGVMRSQGADRRLALRAVSSRGCRARRVGAARLRHADPVELSTTAATAPTLPKTPASFSSILHVHKLRFHGRHIGAAPLYRGMLKKSPLGGGCQSVT